MQSSREIPPTKFGVVLFPGFQALDVFGPVDILNFLSSARSSLRISLLSKDLSPVSTAKVPGGFGQSVVPTHTFDDAPEDIEVLLVPGGTGTRDAENIAQAVDYVRRAFPKLRYFLTVCTGSYLAAKSGVLDGKRATTNKRAFPMVKSEHPQVDWVLEARWVTAEAKVWTSSGVTAGMDMMYAFISTTYGEGVADKLATVAEYRRHTDPSDDPFTKNADPEYAAQLVIPESHGS